MDRAAGNGQRAGGRLRRQASADSLFQALKIVFLVSAFIRLVPLVDICVVLAMSGLGSSLGSVVAGRSPLFARASISMFSVQMITWTGALAAVVIEGISLPFMALVMAALGFTRSLSNIESSVYLMQHAAERVMAGVASLEAFQSLAGCAVGSALGGMLVWLYGTKIAVSFLLIQTTALALFAALIPKLRNQRTLRPPKPPLPPEERRVSLRAAA